MQFKIGSPTNDTNPKLAFVVEITAMRGDADSFSRIRSNPFDATSLQNSQGSLEQLIQLLRAMMDLNRTRWNSARHAYADLPNFNEFLGDSWPYDHDIDAPDMLSSMGNAWRVFYYDAHGIEHKVDVVDA